MKKPPSRYGSEAFLFFCGSGFDFRAILERHADTVLAVNGHVIEHRKPVLIAEGLKRLPFPKFPEGQLYPLPARYLFGDKLRHLIVAVFCFIVLRDKTGISPL